MLLHPDVQTRVQEEVDQVLPGINADLILGIPLIFEFAITKEGLSKLTPQVLGDRAPSLADRGR